VKFIKTHVGHEDELRTKRLSQKEQTLIVEQLQAGVSNDRILENARKIRDNQLDRLNLITKRDLRNLIRRFNIDKKRDADDMVATALKVEEWNKEVQLALAELRQFQKRNLKTKMRGKKVIGEGEITTIRNESPVKEYQGKVVIDFFYFMKIQVGRGMQSFIKVKC
jgi:hypothetical protein